MGGHVRFETRGDGRHELVDGAMNHRTTIRGTVAERREVDTGEWGYPVGVAWRFETDELVFDPGWVAVRDRSGAQLLAGRNTEPFTRTGTTVVELSLPVKVYLETRAPITVQTSSDDVVITFDEPTVVTLGARSYHTAPAGTVTTTPDPEGLAWAISHFGGAMKSLAPERSFPTLRGHPPRVELAEERTSDTGVGIPDSDITLAVEPTVGSVLAAAPLAYYLATPLELSTDPRLEAAGNRFPLDDERACERLLEHAFVCDTAARRHGRYDSELRGFDGVYGLLDFERLYDAPHAERVGAYLTAPTDPTLDAAPDWPTVAHVAPEPSSIEHLPSLVFDLAVIRPTQPKRHAGIGARRAALETFVGTGPKRGVTQVYEGRDSFVELPDSDGATDVWVGDGIPLRGNKSVLEGYEHAHAIGDRDDVEIVVVCNDPEMSPELDEARRNYERRDGLPFEVTVRQGVSVEGLRTLFARESSLLHFVGHATEDGLECHDGYLDTSTVGSVGATTFLLNACQSYPHAVSLVERGAVGGIVTLADIGNDTALTAGAHAARALGRGHLLASAKALLDRASSIPNVYATVGNTMASVVQSEAGCRTTTLTRDGDQLLMRCEQTFDNRHRVGSAGIWKALGVQTTLTGCTVQGLPVSEATVLEHFEMEDEPVFIDGELHWSSDLTREDLP